MKASGKFVTQCVPEGTWHVTDDTVHKMAIERKFHGDLEATGEGYILSALADVKSGVSVAIERVSGTLDGRIGTFLIQSSAYWVDGVSETSASPVRGSGTGELTGLSGAMIFKDAYGNHTYEFEYALQPPNIRGE